MIEIAALWKKQSKNDRTYYTGKLGNGRLLLFLNDKKGNEKAPDLRLYVVEDTAKKEGKEGESSSKPEYEPDIPF